MQKLAGIILENSSDEQKNDDLVNIILDQNDGPVTKYTAIHRALDMAYKRTFNTPKIADALENALEELDKHGDLPSNERK